MCLFLWKWASVALKTQARWQKPPDKFVSIHSIIITVDGDSCLDDSHGNVGLLDYFKPD